MQVTRSFFSIVILPLSYFLSNAQERIRAIEWPEGKKVAISLSFDDARLSQVDSGIALLDELGVKATFYLSIDPMKQRLEGWKRAVTAGHEIGNHSLTHPCSGNYFWVKNDNELENFTLKTMRKNLADANKIIQQELGVTPTLFAYPCGQKYVGRGKKLKSYVPLVAKMFASGRGWFEEMNNDPMFCDFAQLAGNEMDGKSFEQISKMINGAKAHGDWLLLAGHEMKESGPQATSLIMLRQLIEYAKDPANGIWLAPVGEVQEWIKSQKSKGKS